MKPILTGIVGDNSDLLPHILSLHVDKGSRVADVTFGKGVFWKKIQKKEYSLTESDLLTGVDFRNLPFRDGEIDCLIIDPPYMHGGATVKPSINDCYRNTNTSHESVMRLYAAGLLEASRVLKKTGKIIVKCQDEIESGKQRWSHVELINLLSLFGFTVLDLFVLIQKSVPTMREKYQKTARKNHSYALVAEFRR